MKSTVLVAFFICGAALPAMAETSMPAARLASVDTFSSQQRIKPIATRLEVYPSSRQVRRCVDWYAIEKRPSGDVLTPHMRCWWARK